MPRWELSATLLEHRRAASGQYELFLHAPPVADAALPGQFVQVRPLETYSPLLRRSYSILRSNPDKGVISLFYSVQSQFTELLSLKPVGSTLRILGPLGNWFQPVREAKRHVLIAGGYGAPPLCFFASKLVPTLGNDNGVIILCGARSRDLLVGLDEFRALGVETQIATEEGSQGSPGRITDLLEKQLQSGEACAVYACGPNRMLQAVSRLCLKAGAPCQVSAEVSMPCGVGACLGCVVKVVMPGGGFRYKRACVEGPVFQAYELDWEETP